MLTFSRLKLVLFAGFLGVFSMPVLSQGLPPVFINQYELNVAQNARNFYRYLNSVHYRDTGKILDITPDSMALLTHSIGAHSAERSLVTANAQSSFAYFRMVSENNLSEDQFPGIEPRRETVWNFAQRYFDASGRVLAPTWESADLVLACTEGKAFQREWITSVLGAFEEHRRLVQAVIEQSPLHAHRLAVNPPPHYLDNMIVYCGLGFFEACERLDLRVSQVFESHF